MPRVQVSVKPKTKVTIAPRAPRATKATKAIGPDDWIVQDLDLPNFDRIYHISDIHIRPLQRHDEFRQVFTELDEYLKNQDNNGIAVITGDTFDNKTVFRPETFKLCRDMFKMIASHMPLIIIAGNHDMMENNTNRLDAITPVVDDIPNLHYLKYSGLYFCSRNNVCISVSSLYDKAFISHGDIVSSKHYRNGYQYIALYHGTLNGAKTDTGYVATNGEAEDEPEATSRFRALSDFDGYDAVLLGDIHKHQIMRPVPPVAYAGSLIQQNHGETLDGHGILLWTRTEDPEGMSSWACELHNVHNKYGFVDIHCQDGQWINDDIVLPEHCYARLIIKNCTETQIDLIVASLKRLCEHIQITKRQCVSDNIEEFEIPPDIKRKEDELELIREQADIHHYDADQLVALHQEYQKQLDIDPKNMSTAVWRPVLIEFKNMFGYGNNIINKMHFRKGTISISANNACGKTSIVNIILFAIFGRTPINPINNSNIRNGTCTTYDIINNREDSGYVKILLNHGGEYYVIERKTIRKSKSSDSAVLQKLHRYDFTCSIWKSNIRGDKLENLSETRRNNNDTAIQELFGDINDFSLSNLLNKESSLDIVSMSQADQIRVLKRLFRLEVYDKYRELNKEKLQSLESEIKDIGTIRKTLEPLVNDQITDDLLDAKRQAIASAVSEAGDLEVTLNDYRSDQSEFQAMIEKYQSQVKQIQVDDLPTTEAARNDLFEELSSLGAEPPADTGIPLKALEYRSNDLQRQIDQVEGNIAALSNIGSLAELQSKRDELQQQINDLGVDSVGVADQINQRLGKINSKLERLDEQQATTLELARSLEDIIPEIKLELREFGIDADAGDGVNAFKGQMVPLTSNLTAVQDHINRIIEEFGAGDDVEPQEMPNHDRLLKLEADNRILDLKRDRDWKPDTSESDLCAQLLGCNLPSVKYAVSELDLERLQHRHGELVTELEQLCSGRSLSDLLHVMEHDHHDHADNSDGGYDCIISEDVIDDIVAYLQGGEHIRQLDAKQSQIQTQIDRIREQLDINNKIDHNNNIQSKVAQIKYLDNFKQITELRDAVHKYELWKRYTDLCEEEDKHILNQNLQQMVEYLEAVQALDQISVQREQLTDESDGLNDQLVHLQLLHELKVVESDIDAHRKIAEYQRELVKLQRDLDHIRDQTETQQCYEHYVDLTDKWERLEIMKQNDRLQCSIADTKQQLKDIIAKVETTQTELKRQDNYIKGLREELSVLNYRLEQQLDIRARLLDAEQRLIQLEQNIIPYQEYNNILGNKGITSRLLFNKIKSIEDYINTITQKFTKYTIHIIFDEKRQTINMVTENKQDGQYLSTARLCGFEKLMLQIAFKRALNKFSYNSKSSLIIVDEAFDCIDQENFLTKLPEAINLITQDYSNCLAISQRDISHISDHIVTIKQQDGCSHLFQ